MSHVSLFWITLELDEFHRGPGSHPLPDQPEPAWLSIEKVSHGQQPQTFSAES